MSFFLLGKGTGDQLTLLSPELYETRQHALAALSDLTASPAFVAWDADVLVMDVNAGTPVLLVRPATVTPAIEPEVLAEEVLAEEPSLAAVTAASPAVPATESDECLLPESERPVPPPGADDEISAALLELTAEEELVLEEAAAVAVSTDEPTQPPSGEGVFVAEVDEEPVIVVDSAWADAVADTAQEEAGSLKAALQRTTAHMESQGINAPASVVAPVETTAVAPSETVEAVETVEEETATPAESGDAIAAPLETPEDVGAEPAEQVEEPGEEPETAVLESGPEPAEEAAQLPDDGPPPAPVAAWPWDAGTESAADTTEPAETLTPDAGQAPASHLDALEEPGDDDASLIRAPGDDATMSALRPVILGVYDTPPAPPTAEPVSTAEEPEPPATDPALSDFILDLDENPAPPPPPGYEPGDAEIDTMTCDDCVYIETCPNKDEREPATCGSFQWK